VVLPHTEKVAGRFIHAKKISKPNKKKDWPALWKRQFFII
jgi:hypothetical protein